MLRLKWGGGFFQRARIRNECNRESHGVADIKSQNGGDSAVSCEKVRRTWSGQFWVWGYKGRQCRGEPKLTWAQMVRMDIATSEINVTLMGDRIAWKAAIRRPDPATDGIRAWVGIRKLVLTRKLASTMTLCNFSRKSSSFFIYKEKKTSAKNEEVETFLKCCHPNVDSQSS